MLKQAVEAQLPLVSVVTRDTLNLLEVIKEITGMTPQQFVPNNTSLLAGKLYTYIYPATGKSEKVPVLPLASLYEKCVKNSTTLIVVNSPVETEIAFDAGEVPVPRSLVLKFLNMVTDDMKKSKDLLRALGGCTIKETAEFARLTMARDNSLTAEGLMLTRKSVFQGSRGLTQVDVLQPYYEPPKELEQWVLREKDFFLHENDPRLIPRGLMMDGPPGTGKTAGAKWLAHRMGVPLFRLDIGGVKNKYVGESEANLMNSISRLDHEEPCVALLDEIEKIFGGMGESDHGTTTTMLSQLLWWLAERRSRVLVVMTTNNSKKLPRELYREGRIDKVLWFGGLEVGAAKTFAKKLSKTFPAWKPDGDHVFAKIVENAMKASPIDTNPQTVSQAAVTTAVYEMIKASG